MSRILKTGLAIGLAIWLAPHIAPLMPHLGSYVIEGTSIVPPPHAEAAAPVLAPPIASSTPSLSVAQVRAFVLKEARAYGVNPAKADWIIGHESGYCWREGYFDPAIAGPEPDGSTSWGCWQFNDRNDGFDKAIATNFVSSTIQAMQWIVEGKIGHWTTYADCKEYFPDTCPF